MEIEKLTYYIFLFSLSGAIAYIILTVILIIGTKAREIKCVCRVALTTLLLYTMGIALIFTFKNSHTIYPIAGILHLAIFATETKASSSLSYYPYKGFLKYHIAIGVFVILLGILCLIEPKPQEAFFGLLIAINLTTGLAWFLEKNSRALSIASILATLFLLLQYNHPPTAILLSLIPYFVNLIYITIKEYSQTVRSLEILKENKDIIVENQITQFKEFLSLMINKIESRYSSRRMHSLNVATISEGIARELKLNERVVTLTKEGGIIHDIGFLAIDHRKLSDKTTYEEEKDIIKHIWVGKNILEKSNLFIKYLPIVLYHHEKMDGSGPENIKGELLPLPAKIVAVADKFERLINGRDCEKLSIREAIKYLKKHSTLYDSVVVSALERYLSKRFNY